MTAMVDVAFLLLTFFVLTTTMARPAMMVLSKPVKDGETNVDERKILTILLGSHDSVYYYFGMSNPSVRSTGYGKEGLRSIILAHLHHGKELNLPPCVGDETGVCWGPIIVIKPMRTSRYENLIDALDEIKITEARKYAVAEMTSEDSLLLTQSRKF